MPKIATASISSSSVKAAPVRETAGLDPKTEVGRSAVRPACPTSVVGLRPRGLEFKRMASRQGVAIITRLPNCGR
jgi:hypothetical protein